MKILLVHPFIAESLTVMPSLGLGYMATILIEAGHEVRILDCTKDRILPESIGSHITSFNPEIVGLTVFSKGLQDVRKTLATVKTTDPKIQTVVGGPHVSGAPESTIRWLTDADFGIKGEGEIGLHRLVEELEQPAPDFSAVPGLIWREGETIRSNDPEWIEDLETIEQPAWELLQPQSYPHSPTVAFAKKLPTAPMLMSRGCLFPCTFCAAKKIYGKHFRFRSADSIIEEMKLLHEKYGINEIQVLDDNFLQRPDNARQVCEKIIQSRMNITWCLPNGARCDRVDRELAELLVRSGCYKLSIGIESGSQRVLDLMKKMITIEKITEEVNLMHSVGMEITGHFIIGYPGETYEDAVASIKLAKKLPLTYAGFSCFIPLPGSRIGDELIEQGAITMEEFQTTSFYSPKTAYTPHISAKTISNLKKRAYLSFYSKPRVIWHMARSIKSKNHLSNILKRIYYILKEGLFGPQITDWTAQ